jgi:hypothetical protein
MLSVLGPYSAHSCAGICTSGNALGVAMLQLGHQSIASTESYVRPSPVKQMAAFAKAHANSYMVEVLLDHVALQNGAAGRGEPWRYFALGSGDRCSNPFYSRCAHRMACAKCDFYVPSDTQVEKLLEAKGSLERMYMEMPLDDDEKSAVKDRAAAMERLVQKLTGAPVPSPRHANNPRSLPILSG